jgi:hypothetical protein
MLSFEVLFPLSFGRVRWLVVRGREGEANIRVELNETLWEETEDIEFLRVGKSEGVRK